MGERRAGSETGAPVLRRRRKFTGGQSQGTVSKRGGSWPKLDKERHPAGKARGRRIARRLLGEVVIMAASFSRGGG
jgi:hypothetical protein